GEVFVHADEHHVVAIVPVVAPGARRAIVVTPGLKLDDDHATRREQVAQPRDAHKLLDRGDEAEVARACSEALGKGAGLPPGIQELIQLLLRSSPDAEVLEDRAQSRRAAAKVLLLPAERNAKRALGQRRLLSSCRREEGQLLSLDRHRQAEV